MGFSNLVQCMTGDVLSQRRTENLAAGPLHATCKLLDLRETEVVLPLRLRIRPSNTSSGMETVVFMHEV
jgi:hypothetical protein